MAVSLVMAPLQSFMTGVEHVTLLFFLIGFLGFLMVRTWCKVLSWWAQPPCESTWSENDALKRQRESPEAEEHWLVPYFRDAFGDSTEATTSGKSSELTDDAVVGVIARPLPADICGRISCFTGFEAVGALASCSRHLRSEMWESKEVWLALSTAGHLRSAQIVEGGAFEARNAFRRAHFRTDLERLRSLAAVGRPQPILEEARHVACGLLPDDLPPSGLADFIQIASRILGAHDPESSAAISAAECLLRAARRCMELFTEEQLEHLEYAYKSVHQLHALMLSSMRDSHEDTLSQSQDYWGPPSLVDSWSSDDSGEFDDFFDIADDRDDRAKM